MQLKLDFSKISTIDNGKKLKRLSFTASDDLQEFLDMLVDKLGTDRSNYIYNAVVEKMRQDLAKLLLPQPHLNKSLSEILKNGFG